MRYVELFGAISLKNKDARLKHVADTLFNKTRVNHIVEVKQTFKN